MSMVTYPLNNIEYTAEDAELFHSTRASGIYATNAFNYSVTGADNTIVIETGIAWIKNSEFSGKVVAQKAPISLDMGLPDSVYPRIDAVVIQFDANKNGTEVVVKRGVSASAPAAPAISKTESLYELHLYHVRREPGAAAISVSSITDLRLDPNYCGLMADSVTHVDTAAISAQVNALIESLRQEIQSVKDGSAYLMRSGGTMSGPINMNGNRIEGIGNPVDDQDAVPLKVANDLIGTAVGTAKNELSRKLCVPNLLDNSDFRNPVNQRGVVSGTEIPAYTYFLDRWKSISNIAVVSWNSNVGLYANALFDLHQYIQNSKTLVGKTLTLAAKCSGKTLIATRTIVGATSWDWTPNIGWDNTSDLAAIVEDGSGKVYVQIGLHSDGNNVEWAALYEGEYTAETLPEYQPKGYANELLACNVADSGNVSGMKLLWENASPASAFAAQTISLDLSGYDSVFISCFASNYSGGTDKESHFAIKGEKTTLHSQGSVLANRDVTVSATGLTFTDGVQRPTYGSWTSNTDNHGIVPDKIYGIKGVSA